MPMHFPMWLPWECVCVCPADRPKYFLAATFILRQLVLLSLFPSYPIGFHQITRVPKAADPVTPVPWQRPRSRAPWVPGILGRWRNVKCGWPKREAPQTDSGVGAAQPEDGRIGLDSCSSTDACSDSAAGRIGIKWQDTWEPKANGRHALLRRRGRASLMWDAAGSSSWRCVTQSLRRKAFLGAASLRLTLTITNLLQNHSRGLNCLSGSDAAAGVNQAHLTQLTPPVEKAGGWRGGAGFTLRVRVTNQHSGWYLETNKKRKFKYLAWTQTNVGQESRGEKFSSWLTRIYNCATFQASRTQRGAWSASVKIQSYWCQRGRSRNDGRRKRSVCWMNDVTDDSCTHWQTLQLFAIY